MQARPTLAALAVFGLALLPAAQARALESFASYSIEVFSGFELSLPTGISIFPDTGERGFFTLVEVGAAAGFEEDFSDIDASDGAASLDFIAFGAASQSNLGGVVARNPYGVDFYGFRNDSGLGVSLTLSWSLAAETAAGVTDGPAAFEFAGAYGYSDIGATWGDGDGGTNEFFEFVEAESAAGSSPFDCGCDVLLPPGALAGGEEVIFLEAGDTLRFTLYAEASGIADVAPVPVPAPFALLAAGVLGLGGIARRRRVRAG